MPIEESKDTAPQNAAQQAIKRAVEEDEGVVQVEGGRFAAFITVLAITFSVFQLYATSFAVFDAIKLRAWHIIFLLSFSFLLYPPRKGIAREGRLPSLVDCLLLALGLATYGYLIINYETITLRGGYFLPQDYVVASLGVLLAFEAARRVVGNLAWLGLAFFLYNFLGAYIPGAFGHVGFSWNRVVSHLFWGSQGLLGVGVGVSATYIFLFVLFGVFLKHSGFSAFINDLALALVGRTAGGPAKVAVFASALMGMINGSALANVATTGAITIPLMKKTGYRAEFAGAVEAVASTGGQFAPPIMGAVGFIMAEFLGVPYVKVMLAAAIPAFLYYLALLFAVHFEARSAGLKGLSAENIPNAWRTLKDGGHLLLPLVVLMGLLSMGYTALYAAVFSIFATIFAAALRKSTRMPLASILAALKEGALSAVGVGVACVIIGVIIGTVSLTGVGLTFGHQVLRLVSEGQLLLGGFFVMVMSTILGMGVPGVAAYVIVAAVAAPVLIKLGASAMAAHMFCLIYACLSNITPPVAMASYVAAGIAQADQTKTSLIAMRLGMAGFILPFFFLYNPILLYDTASPAHLVVLGLLSASLGAVALASALQGWLVAACTWFERLLLLAVAVLCIDPDLVHDAAGVAIFVFVFFWQKRPSRSAAAA